MKPMYDSKTIKVPFEVNGVECVTPCIFSEALPNVFEVPKEKMTFSGGSR